MVPHVVVCSICNENYNSARKRLSGTCPACVLKRNREVGTLRQKIKTMKWNAKTPKEKEKELEAFRKFVMSSIPKNEVLTTQKRTYSIVAFDEDTLISIYIEGAHKVEEPPMKIAARVSALRNARPLVRGGLGWSIQELLMDGVPLKEAIYRLVNDLDVRRVNYVREGQDKRFKEYRLKEDR